MKAIVVAYDLERGIGANNDLLWRYRSPADMPGELAHFKAITMGGSLIMGRKTFDSIGRALPGRQNIVLASHANTTVPNVQFVTSLAAAYVAAEHDIYIIGGGSVYEQAIGDVQHVYATEVQATFPAATVFFPVLPGSWKEVSREHHPSDETTKYAYDFVVYTRT